MVGLNSLMTIYGLRDKGELLKSRSATTTWMRVVDARQLKNCCTLFGSKAGLCKNQGFSSKTQPSGFNWFKPGFNAFFWV